MAASKMTRCSVPRRQKVWLTPNNCLIASGQVLIFIAALLASHARVRVEGLGGEIHFIDAVPFVFVKGLLPYAFIHLELLF